MADENKTERVQLLMTPSELKTIDDWSFEYRVRGRAEAIRRLCQVGIFLSRTGGDLIAALEGKDHTSSDPIVASRLSDSIVVTYMLLNAANIGVKDGFTAEEADALYRGLGENNEYRAKFKDISDRVLNLMGIQRSEEKGNSESGKEDLISDAASGVIRPTI